MHIPDGLMSGEAVAAGWAAASVGIAVCLREARAQQRERDLPVAGLAAAVFVAGDAPIFPIGAGANGHLLGGMLAVALLGPWLGALTIAVVCTIQALAFGDGGIAALGLTIVNLAFVPAAIGYPLLLVLRRAGPKTPLGLGLACGISAAVSLLAAAAFFVQAVKLGAAIPIDWGKLEAATMGTYAVVAVIEGVVTILIVRALLGLRPDLVYVATPDHLLRRAVATREGTAEP